MLIIKRRSCEYQLVKSFGMTGRGNRTQVFRLRSGRSNYYTNELAVAVGCKKPMLPKFFLLVTWCYATPSEDWGSGKVYKYSTDGPHPEIKDRTRIKNGAPKMFKIKCRTGQKRWIEMSG